MQLIPRWLERGVILSPLSFKITSLSLCLLTPNGMGGIGRVKVRKPMSSDKDNLMSKAKQGIHTSHGEAGVPLPPPFTSFVTDHDTGWSVFSPGAVRVPVSPHSLFSPPSLTVVELCEEQETPWLCARVGEQ